MHSLTAPAHIIIVAFHICIDVHSMTAIICIINKVFSKILHCHSRGAGITQREQWNHMWVHVFAQMIQKFTYFPFCHLTPVTLSQLYKTSTDTSVWQCCFHCYHCMQHQMNCNFWEGKKEKKTYQKCYFSTDSPFRKTRSGNIHQRTTGTIPYRWNNRNLKAWQIFSLPVLSKRIKMGQTFFFAPSCLSQLSGCLHNDWCVSTSWPSPQSSTLFQCLHFTTWC